MAHKIRQALLGNLWLKFLSLVIGAAVWMMVSNANNPTRTQLFTNIPYKNIMRDMRAMYNWVSGSTYADRATSGAVLRKQAEAARWR